MAVRRKGDRFAVEFQQRSAPAQRRLIVAQLNGRNDALPDVWVRFDHRRAQPIVCCWPTKIFNSHRYVPASRLTALQEWLDRAVALLNCIECRDLPAVRAFLTAHQEPKP